MGAEEGEELINPMTGERIVFLRTALDTGGELLEFDDFWTRKGHRVPEHVHPKMEERWKIIAGTPVFKIGGTEHTVGAGDTMVAPPGTPHTGWNPSEEEVHLRVQMRPALRWQEFTEELFRLAREGRTDDSGLPEGEDLARLLREFSEEIAPP